MDIAITRMSSKGQVVIPSEMRRGIDAGDKLIILRENGRLMMKKASDVDARFQDDLRFAEKTEKAWNRIRAGNGRKMDFDDFIDEMKKW